MKTASSIGVDLAASEMRDYLRRERWLQRDNRYRIGIAEKISSELSAGGSNNARHIRAYIVASAPLHAADAWGYLGRSLASQVAGDWASAIHMAYYTELRAAMAVLAVAGVGVLKSKHFVIKATGECVLVPAAPRTHDMVWQSLELWANGADAGDIVGGGIAPGGISITDWCSAHPGLVSWKPVATAWLLAWGVDLKDYAADRQSRNTVSYRPSALGGLSGPGAATTRSWITELWSALEPGESSYGPLDRALLREAVREGARANGLGTPMAVVADQIVSSLGLTPTAQRAWKSVLVSRRRVPIIEWAKGKAPLSSPALARQVSSRALLLLRVATGATSEMLRRGGVAPADLEFWRVRFGAGRGLWEGAGPPLDLNDLWADVEAGLVSLGSLAPGTPLQLREAFGGDCSVLEQTERAALWGLRAS